MKMTLKEAKEQLEQAGVPDPLADARRIFSELGRLKSYQLLSLSACTDSEAVISAIERRKQREPLQYIIGETDFYRERYKVTPDCLIPREDTEILVDYAVKNIPRGARFIDLCAGSGCIALSVLNNTENTSALLVDLSEGALKVASENALRLGLSERVTLMRSDATKPIKTDKVFAVLSNPPYVSNSAYTALEKEIFFEPKEAFVGGEDGADFYRSITPLYKDLIEDDGFIAYEIGYDQSEIIKDIAKENEMSVSIYKDLSGNDRLAVLTN